MTVWFASNNAHKAKELRSILTESLRERLGDGFLNQGFELKIPAEEGLAFNPRETGAVFMENALIKARALFSLTGGLVIADDSGLCIDALDGRPGIYSARYRGGECMDGLEDTTLPPLSDGERNAIILHEMQGKTDRRARFVCAMALIVDKDHVYTAEETLEGEIIENGGGSQAAGEAAARNNQGGGFGYDPVLYIPGAGTTAAGLDPAEKNRISHRGKAGRAIAIHLARIVSADFIRE